MGVGAGGGVWAHLLGDGIKAGVVVLLSLLAGFFTAFPLGWAPGAIFLPWPLGRLLGEKIFTSRSKDWMVSLEPGFLSRFGQEYLEGQFLPLKAG